MPNKTILFVTIFPCDCTEFPDNSTFSTFTVQKNPWVFQVFQVCGHPVQAANYITLH